MRRTVWGQGPSPVLAERSSVVVGKAAELRSPDGEGARPHMVCGSLKSS